MIQTKFVAAALAILALTGSASAQAEIINGEVRKVDQPAQKITLRHEPIKSLDMDSMTMVFRVKDAAMLKGLKAGDRVRFEAARVDGAITVIRLEKRR